MNLSELLSIVDSCLDNILVGIFAVLLIVAIRREILYKKKMRSK